MWPVEEMRQSIGEGSPNDFLQLYVTVKASLSTAGSGVAGRMLRGLWQPRVQWHMELKEPGETGILVGRRTGDQAG